MSSSFKFDPSKSGLRKVMREYEELALRCVWESGEEGAGSRAVREYVLERQTERTNVSRASIILFLEKLRKQEILGYNDETGKGGHRRIYYPLMNERDYKKHLLKTIVESLMRDFPEETKEALNEL